MTPRTVARSAHGTITPGVPDTIRFTSNWGCVEVINRSAGGAGLFFTIDETTPAPFGDDTEFVNLPAGSAMIVGPLLGDNIVKVVSATPDAYSVTGLPSPGNGPYRRWRWAR